jgi:hypothetical protein
VRKRAKKVLGKIKSTGARFAEIAEIRHRSPISEASPLFPIGCPRSGTTLLGKILNSHPNVLMTNETAVFLQIDNAITQSRLGAPAGLCYGKEYNWLWADHLSEKAGDLIESYYDKIRAYEGKERLIYWGEKHPHHYECLDFLFSSYPNARYIYIVRDPRDTACSISEVSGADRSDALRQWRTVVDIYEPFVRRFDATSVLTIHYEDFVADYERMTKHVFDWLGIELAPEVVSFLQKHRNVDAHSLWMPPSDHIHVDFKSRSVGRWRNEFSEPERVLASEVAGDFLEQYGYPDA